MPASTGQSCAQLSVCQVLTLAQSYSMSYIGTMITLDTLGIIAPLLVALGFYGCVAINGLRERNKTRKSTLRAQRDMYKERWLAERRRYNQCIHERAHCEQELQRMKAKYN